MKNFPGGKVLIFPFKNFCYFMRFWYFSQYVSREGSDAHVQICSFTELLLLMGTHINQTHMIMGNLTQIFFPGSRDLHFQF